MRLTHRRFRQFVVAGITAVALLGTAVALVPATSDAANNRTCRPHHHHRHCGTTTTTRPSSTTTRASSTTTATTMPATTTTTSTSGVRPLPATLDGITFDNDADIGTAQLAAQLAMVEALPHMPTVRIVFDTGTTPADYTRAVAALHPYAFLMGELVDSSDLKSVSAAAYHAKTASFIAAFGPSIDIYEVGNEVNGNWTGTSASVEAKIVDAYQQVQSAGLTAALTLWENAWAPDHCGDGQGELTAQDFSAQFVPASMRLSIPYVFVSWYPTQCTGLPNDDVPVVTISAEMQGLHALYPAARVGFGELGLPNAVNASTTARAQGIVAYYYGLNLGLAYYAAFDGWWYSAEDAVPISKPIGQSLVAAMP